MKRETKRETKVQLGFKKIALLVLTTVFLILSTYAWFTSNTLVQVESLELYVQATDGFQISLDALNWKTIIQASEITGNAVNQIYNVNDTYILNRNHVPAEMKPVSTGLTTDSDGYMEMFLGTAELEERIGSPYRNQYILSSNKLTELQGRGVDGGHFVAFDLFFKTTFDIELHLDNMADAVDNALDGTPSKGKGIENSARIAFVEQGAIPMATAMTLAENALVAQAQALKYTAYNDGRNITIWEPNYDAHTSAAKTDVFQLFGIPINDLIWTAGSASTTAKGRIDYDGISGQIERLTPVLLTKNNETDHPTYFKNIPDSQVIVTEKNTRYTTCRYA